MKPMFVAAAFACSLPLSAQEQARDTDAYFPQQMTAKDLMLACSSSALTSTGRERRRYCSGFVSGVEEGVRLVGQIPPSGGNSALCVPPGTTSRAFGTAYIRYASRKNLDLGRPAALVVLEALRATFPCADPAPDTGGSSGR